MGKKEKENIYLDWFVKKINWNCHIENDESPDFKVIFSDKTIGIEITNLYKSEEGKKGSTNKENEIFLHNLLQKTADEYYKRTNTPIHVKISIYQDKTDFDPEKFAEMLLKKQQSAVTDKIKFDFDSQMKVYVNRLSYEFSGYRRWIVINNHIGWSQKIEPGILQKKIDSKKKKLSLYRQKYQEVVLLIVADRIFESGRFHLDELKYDFFNNGFNAIYLLLYPDRVVKIG